MYKSLKNILTLSFRPFGSSSHIDDDFKATVKINRVAKNELLLHVPHTNLNKRLFLLPEWRLNPKLFGRVREGYNLKEVLKLIKRTHFNVIDYEFTFKTMTAIIWELNVMMSDYRFPFRFFLSALFYLIAKIAEMAR